MVKVKLLNACILDHLERWGGIVPRIKYWEKHWPEIESRLQAYGFDQQTQDAMKSRLDALVDHIGEPFAELQKNGPVIWKEQF
jgi:hypothetical protein